LDGVVVGRRRGWAKCPTPAWSQPVMERRSISFKPPQMPCGSRIRKAKLRQSLRTGQEAHTALACRSRTALASLRSKWVGAKNMTADWPRQAAPACQSSGAGKAVTRVLSIPKVLLSRDLDNRECSPSADNPVLGGTVHVLYGLTFAFCVNAFPVEQP
jgi:hypothetical protein